LIGPWGPEHRRFAVMLSRIWRSWRRRMFCAALFGGRRPPRRRTVVPTLEPLEGRVVPSIVLNYQEFHDPTRIPAGLKPGPTGILPKDNGLPFAIGYMPDDLRIAYGIDKVMFGSVAGDGTGQTIAIVDAYDDP